MSQQGQPSPYNNGPGQRQQQLRGVPQYGQFRPRPAPTSGWKTVSIVTIVIALIIVIVLVVLFIIYFKKDSACESSLTDANALAAACPAKVTAAAIAAVGNKDCKLADGTAWLDTGLYNIKGKTLYWYTSPAVVPASVLGKQYPKLGPPDIAGCLIGQPITSLPK